MTDDYIVQDIVLAKARRLGISKTELARRIHVNYTTINKWECHAWKMSMHRAEKAFEAMRGESDKEILTMILEKAMVGV